MSASGKGQRSADEHVLQRGNRRAPGGGFRGIGGTVQGLGAGGGAHGDHLLQRIHPLLHLPLRSQKHQVAPSAINR